MKKAFLFLVVILLVVSCFAFTVSATAESSGEIVRFADGSYLVIELYPTVSRSTSAKTGNKQYTYYTGNGEEAWRAVLTGTFSYDGSTSVCTASSCAVTIVKGAWYEISKTVSKSGSTATADLTMGNKLLGITIDKREISLTLTCDANGNLS